MKAAHLPKIAARLDRVLQVLLPEEVGRGPVTDPELRLKKLIQRVDGWPELPPGSSWRNAIQDIARILEQDVPDLIDAVREANQERDRAVRALSARAGTRYQVTITSDAPIAVLRQEIVEPPEPEPGEDRPVGQVTVTPEPFEINWRTPDAG